MSDKANKASESLLPDVVASLMNGPQISDVCEDRDRGKLTSLSTLRTVSICHRLLGANRSAARQTWVVMPSLNSLSATSKNARSSRVNTRTLESLVRA